MYLAICDDQAEELATVITLLDQWQRDRNTSLRYQVFQNASKMLDAAENERFSLYLLDVMMPGMNGLAAAREIRQFDDFAEIVFLTSSPGFAYRHLYQCVVCRYAGADRVFSNRDHRLLYRLYYRLSCADTEAFPCRTAAIHVGNCSETGRDRVDKSAAG